MPSASYGRRTRAKASSTNPWPSDGPKRSPLGPPQAEIRHLEDHGGEFVCEGGNHTIYRYPADGHIRSVPRHSKVKDTTAREICKDMGVPPP